MTDCSVCHGTGKYLPSPDKCVTTAPVQVTCHGCGGLGWVTIIEQEPYVPIPQPFYPQPYWPFPWSPVIYSFKIGGEKNAQ